MNSLNKQKTIYDISKAAGVSIATVSRVLNNSPKVSEKTKQRVRNVINEMDYAPNVFARGLGTGSMETIGILCADVADIYLANAVSYLERELKKRGFNTVLNCTGYELKEKMAGMRVMEQRKVDAVIMVGSQYVESSDRKNRYIIDMAKKVPVMLLNGFIEGKNIYSVMSDDMEGFRYAAETLIKKGCNKIMFLYRDKTYSRNRKLEGYSAALKANGLEFDSRLVFQSNKRIQGIGADIERFFADGNMIDAILACDDELAIGALKYLRMNKMSVPEDISVIGCNNSVLSISCEPELTSIDNVCEELCITLVQNLMRILTNEKAVGKTVISVNLVERGTTR